ncbi:DUF6965 family protein [Pedobacter faecalis]|uniref:DUF6965 family protein n=1 Tax=Pedobacter faecalis TaxID=3041495 RepID=UPI00254EF3E1|nr:hypothetical protein [Pedobacter sp. ELA7]
MNADEYEAAFHGIDLPKEVELFPGSYVPDVRFFLDAQLNLLRHLGTERQRDAVRYRLNRLLEIINENNENS